MKIFLRVTTIAVFLMVALFSLSSAEEYEYREYTVKKGDTLWDISQLVIEDNFQWPLIWNENTDINNPDLIYPGQVIKIPIGVIEQKKGELAPISRPVEEVPEPLAEQPTPEKPEEVEPEPEVTEIAQVKIKPIVSKKVILESGYIATEIPNKGTIASSYLGREIFGIGDEIYVDTVEPAEVGDKFYVIRMEAEVKHPATKEEIGFMIRILGTVEIEEAGTSGLRAKVIDSFDRIDVGDILDNYYEIEDPYVTGEPRKPEVDGVVIASRFMKEISGTFETVFIDRGIASGLRIGDLIMTFARGTDDRMNARMQVINIRENTSLVLILESGNEVIIGDIVTQIQ
jgi:LysM repeat protein